ncbi:MAG: winged helix-turn-helix transcriptional regulator [Oscillospiraceae bacterium]|nr:winged helix-turn-helix transcriptional regulator [Oscillospiraceae bacterium]
MEDLFCTEVHSHDEPVEAVRAAIPDDALLRALAELYKVFGDPTRMKILSCLSIRELCVCDIAECLGLTISAASHQLRVLRQAHLVKPRKSGKEVFYSLADDHVEQILACGLSHVTE